MIILLLIKNQKNHPNSDFSVEFGIFATKKAPIYTEAIF